jgi:putative heme transporter
VNLGQLKKRLGLHERTHAEHGASPAPEPEPEPADLAHMFNAPTWLRDLGLLAWFLVGVGLVLVGAMWLLATTSTIVMPVVLGSVIAAVAAPIVSKLESHRIPRALGSALVLLGLIAISIAVGLLVINGIAGQKDEIKAGATESLDKLESWAQSAGTDGTSGSKEDIASAVPDIGSKLLGGAASGIENLTSFVFFLSFTAFTIFFVLKDGRKILRFVNSHMGVPVPVATTVTRRSVDAMQRYFFGLTIVAAFNGIVVGFGAWALDVPLWATIGVVTFVTAYVPFIGAFVSGAFAVMLALASGGTSTAATMLVIVILANGLLQNIVQPIAFGAALDLNPLVVLIVTISAGALFGMVGLILAAPLTSAAVKIFQDLGRAQAAEDAKIAEERGPPSPAPA